MVIRRKGTYVIVALLFVVMANALFVAPAQAKGLSLSKQGLALGYAVDLLPYTGGMSLTSLVALVAGLALLGVGAVVTVWLFRSSRREDSDD